MNLVKRVHSARFQLSNFQCHISQPAICEHFDGMSLKCSFALCHCFLKAAYLYLFIILLFHSIPEAVLLIIDPGKLQRGQKQLKLECSWYRITMQFPFFRKSEAFLAVGFRDHSFSYMGTWVSAKESQFSLKKNKTLFLVFHSQPASWVCVCVCVCVRERERQRERNKDRIRDKDREKNFFSFSINM